MIEILGGLFKSSPSFSTITSKLPSHNLAKVESKFLDTPIILLPNFLIASTVARSSFVSPLFEIAIMISYLKILQDFY